MKWSELHQRIEKTPKFCPWTGHNKLKISRSHILEQRNFGLRETGKSKHYKKLTKNDSESQTEKIALKTKWIYRKTWSLKTNKIDSKSQTEKTALKHKKGIQENPITKKKPIENDSDSQTEKSTLKPKWHRKLI